MVHFPQFFNMGSNDDGGGCASIQGLTTQIGTGTVNDYDFPFDGLWDYSFTAIIILQSELGTEKQLTSMQFDAGGFSTPFTVNNQDIYIGHIAESIFPPTALINLSDVTLSDYIQVVNSQTVTVSSNTWKEVTFDTNFCYNGTSNIVVVWWNRDGSWQSGNGYAECDSTKLNRALDAQKDNSEPTGSANRGGFVYNTKFSY